MVTAVTLIIRCKGKNLSYQRNKNSYNVVRGAVFCCVLSLRLHALCMSNVVIVV